MKKTLGTLFALVALAAVPFFVEAADETKTLSGEPVDMVCYMTGKSGPGHASCAKTCAEKGNPIGLLVKTDGKSELYLVLGSGGKAAKDLMAAHMGMQVKATGKVSKKDGLNIITLEKVEM